MVEETRRDDDTCNSFRSAKNRFGFFCHPSMCLPVETRLILFEDHLCDRTSGFAANFVSSRQFDCSICDREYEVFIQDFTCEAKNIGNLRRCRIIMYLLFDVCWFCFCPFFVPCFFFVFSFSMFFSSVFSPSFFLSFFVSRPSRCQKRAK